VTRESAFGDVTIDGLNATYMMRIGQSGNDYFLFKVSDSAGAESEEKRFDLVDFDNG